MVYLIGTNHKFSDKSLRERLSFTRDMIINGLEFLKGKGISGCVIISTCNRFEIYFSTNFKEEGIKKVFEMIERIKNLKFNKIPDYFYFFENEDVLRHLSYVCSGIDSLIIGETQIKKQVENSYFISLSIGMTDRITRKVFECAFKISKIVRNETKINEGKISVGSVVIDFIKEKVGKLNDKKILIIGAGKVSELVLSYLKKENCSLIFIGNRTYERAKYLSEKFGGFAFKFDRLYEILRDCDICISSTSSPHFIIKKEKFPIMDKKIIIVDLAVPRDIDPEIKMFKNVELYQLEDLNVIIERNIENRKKEAEKAKKIIDFYVEKIWGKKFIELEQDQVILL
ncbi:MAG: glutamyl-tRNA reductase [Candidatus Ratteibacteria bacterium]